MVSDWYSYPYNYSNGTEVQSFGGFFQYTSSVLTSGHLATGIILLVWLFTFGFSMVAGSRKALAVASFISFVMSIYFVRLGMINLTIPITLIVLTVVGMLLGSKEDSYSL